MILSLSNFTGINRTALLLSDYCNIMMRLDIRGELQYWSFDVYTIWSLQWWERRDKCSVLIARGNDGSCNLYNKLACKCLPGFKPKSPENWNSGDFSGGCIRSSDERDSLTRNSPIRDSRGETLVSNGEKFELGFFTPNGSTERRYVGIWFYRSSPRTVVWVANRDSPLLDHSGVFSLDREANQFVIWKRSIRYWRSGVSDNGGSSRSEMPSAISYFLSNFTSTSVRNDSVPYITSSLYTNTRMVMSFAGQIQYLQLNTEKTWSVIWAQPRTRCSLYNACGNFGSCNSNNEVVCKCLPGFQPVSPEYWNSGDNSRGCARRSPLCSNSATSDTFLSLKMMKVANPDAQFKANSEEECKMECLNNCQCEAFSYEEAETTNGGESESATCWIWTDDLRDIQEEYDGGRDLHVRVSVSDTESAATACGTCGTNMIPYPLSTGPKCGDPAYLNFYCNLSSGQLNFKARGDTYRVTKINPGTHTFVIQTETADSCKSIKSNGNLLQLNQSSPFHVIRFCNVDLGNISSAISFTGGDEVEIGWDPPPEPTCFSSSDCKYWPNSSCSARIDGKKLCLCNAKFKWDGLKLKCTEAGHYSEKKDSSSIGKIPLSLIIAVALISLIALAVLSSTIVCICLQRRRMPKLRENKGIFPRNLGFHFNGSERLAWNLWKEDKAMKLLDQTLSKTCNTDEYVKCVNVGLLCVQEDPGDRPTVSNILFMLGSETPTLPDPKQPAFVFRRCPSSRASSSSKPDTVSNNGASENSAILRVTLVPDGRIELLLWQEINNDWLSMWQWPSTYCEFYAQCSPFSSCDPKGSQDHCKCLPGFQPKVQQEWDTRNWTGGTCVRQKALRCDKDDGFLELDFVGSDLYIRLHDGDPVGNVKSSVKFTRKNKRSIIIAVAAVSIGLVCVLSGYFIWRKSIGKQERIEETCTGMNTSIELGKSETELNIFSFNQVVAVTNDFCEENKLGKGGFGPVYKGNLLNQEVAIKRLSKKSEQGIEEFMNELKLIAKLQHTNLVRLLGCCVEGEEKMLVYEYLPNRSLDKFLFDPYEKANLDWSKRFRIIEGIAQGLLYIHKYSRLKVIHRDLKASNILLDEAMNPKISDFGMARMFGSDQTEADTKRVVGTYGYMSPEYALYGKFSEKSDVFSFGVLLLELVTGKRNSEFFGSELPLTLQGWAWEMWNDDRGLDLIDLSIRDTSECPERALKCIHVGLLCVQESPVDRPAMPLVVLMLGNDNASLPSPEEPAFSSIKRRKSSNVASSSSSDHNTLSSCSNNELTITLPQAR
ncbi:hypothetical protein NC652_031906 [Populus alba x Populus x berolinensis]|nr:hypothetical protein NC652_031906 [Populus alba x Populus x berolinensis]